MLERKHSIRPGPSKPTTDCPGADPATGTDPKRGPRSTSHEPRRAQARQTRGPRGWAPGEYLCHCAQCHEDYFGDKRSFICADCAYVVTPSTHDLVLRVREILAECTPDQRVDILHALGYGYCRGCGRIHVDCDCHNHE